MSRPGWRGLVRALVRATTPPGHRDDLEGALLGEVERVSRERGRAAAGAFLAREAVGLAAHGLGERLASGLPLGAGLGTDARLAARRLRRAPGFTAVVVLTLALAVGITSAVFSLVDAFFLRPLPYAEPDRLVALWETERDGPEITTVSPPNVQDWERSARTLGSVAWFNGWPVTLTGPGGAVRVAGSAVSVDLFDVLGVRPALGPGFAPEHEGTDSTGFARVTVIGHDVWVRHFGADPDVIGRTVELNDAPWEVVGVMPEGFRHPATFLSAEPAELWVPLGLGPSDDDRDMRFLHVVARLAPGADVEDARAEMRRLADDLSRAHPDANAGRSVVVRPVDDQVFGEQRPALMTLLVAAGLVLLATCVNTANLLLARGIARSRELAVRAALGSGRVRLLRELLMEALLLALIGGALGAAALLVGEGVLRSAAGPWLNPLADVRIDLRMVLFTLAVGAGSGFLFGALPALRLSSPDLRSALATRGAGSGGSRARALLVAVEAALTVVLLCSAGLVGQGVVRLLGAPAGFAVDRVLLFEVRPPWSGYRESEEVMAFYARLRGALEARPEIEATGFVSDLPLTSENRGVTFTVPGSDSPAEEVSVEYHDASPGYFAAAGIPLLRGRDFTDADTREVPFVAVVNETFAARTWGGRSPIGEELVAEDGTAVRVVGVVGVTADDALGAPPSPRVFFPTGQTGSRTFWVVARTAGPAREALALVRPTVAGIDPRVPVSGLRTMEDHVAASVATPRGVAGVTGVFATLALLLAGVGVYGVLAHDVTERRSELGVRAALGARRGSLVRLVVLHSVRVAGVGTAVGVALALVAGRALASRLPDVPGFDPLVLTATVATLALATLAASWIPARRAARIDPLVAMRGD